MLAATPRTETVYRRPRPELLAPGVVLFVAGWVGDIGFTYGYHHDPAWHSLIPLVGPFWQLTERYGLDGPPVNTGSADADARINKNIDSANTTIRVLALTGAALSAAFQLTGLGLTIAGAATRKARRRYAHTTPDVGRATAARAAARPGLSITASGLRFRF